jgi:DNA mismatch repair protein MutL
MDRELPRFSTRLDHTSFKVSAQVKESLAGEQDAQASLCRVTISSHRSSWRTLSLSLGVIACAGGCDKGEEMNALLREKETTPNSGPCNHGRPTYVELRLADIERLFGRR